MNATRRLLALALAVFLLPIATPSPAKAILDSGGGSVTYKTGCTGKVFLELDFEWRTSAGALIDDVAVGPYFNACYNPTTRVWSMASYTNSVLSTTAATLPGWSFTETSYYSYDPRVSSTVLKAPFTFKRKDPKTGAISTLSAVLYVDMMGMVDGGYTLVSADGPPSKTRCVLGAAPTGTYTAYVQCTPFGMW